MNNTDSITDGACKRWIANQIARECPEEWRALERTVRVVEYQWWQAERAEELALLMERAVRESAAQRAYAEAVRRESRQIRRARPSLAT